MDLCFQEFQAADDFWYDLSLLNPSAFLPYTAIPTSEISACNLSNSTNINKRMIDFMRRSLPGRVETQESDSARCYRRKMSERTRREKEKNGYLALHAMLPLGTRNDKNSIMQMAMKRIQELQRSKEVLERRNRELEVKIEAMKAGNVRRTKIEIKVGNPTSGVDYMVEVLKLLNSMGSKTESIKSRISDEELVAVLDIETQISDDEIRKKVEATLEEVERKLLAHFSGSLHQSPYYTIETLYI